MNPGDTRKTDRFEALRRQAEALIAKRPGTASRTSDSILELIQELRIHQAELEIQNGELQSAQRALADLHREYVEDYYERAPCGYLTVNRAGYVTRINETAMAILGARDTNLLHESFLQLIHPQSENAYLAAVREVKDGGQRHVDVKLKRRTPEGWTWVRLDIRLDPPGAGRPRQHRMSLVDISAQRRSEAALRNSEALMRSFFEAAPIGIGMLSGRVILNANDRFCELTGYAREELVGKNAGILYPTVEEYEYVGRERRRQLRKSGIATVESRLLRKNGDVLDVLIRSAPIETGHVSEPTTFTVLDITDRKRALESLKHAKETLERQVAERTAELEDRARQLQQLSLQLSEAEDRERERLATVLHDDLQQLLATVKLKIESSLAGSGMRRDPDAQLRRCAELLGDSIRKTRRLSYELAPPALRRFGLLPCLDQLAGDMKADHGLEVRVTRHPDAEPASRVVAALLYRAVKELLFNVVKHSGAAEAHIEAAREGDWVVIRVADAGKGGDLEQVYARRGLEPGFGLFSIDERIQSLGGRMTIETIPGDGWVTTLSIPRSMSAGAEPPPVEGSGTMGRRSRPSEAAAAAPPDGQTAIRILLADDHGVMREALASLLGKQADVEVVGQAPDGRRAVALARDLRPDLILMDVSMPDMDGIDATARILREDPAMRIIGLSMHDDPKTREGMIAAGAIDYMCKSDPAANILAAIRRAFGAEAGRE